MRILTINSGSSSIKIALYEMRDTEMLLLAGSLQRIGQSAGVFQISDSHNRNLVDIHTDIPDHDAALKLWFDWLEKHEPGKNLDAVAHRIVHGGAKFYAPHRITPEVISELKHIIHLAPDHLPHEIKAIRATSNIYPDLPQVACFDTAFHHDMPHLAKILPIPRHYQHAGLIRYGFHGLSYEYIMQELYREAGEDVANGKVIIAHLGNGASMVAVKHGKSVETTMGFTPAGGLVMSTRSGDLDPGVLIYLVQEKGIHSLALNELINNQSGLLGVSGISSDMRDLLDKEENDTLAHEAIELFCYQASKHLGALAAVLGGLDTLIFTAGIGENSPIIRQRICQKLVFLGIQIDARRNKTNSTIISPEKSAVTVRVMKTDEDLMMARHTYKLICKE